MERPSDTARDLGLSVGEASTIGFKPICEHVCAGFTVDQLRIDLSPVTHPPHTSFENITDAEISANLLHINGFALVGKGRVAGDHETVGDPREIGSQIVGDSV